MGIAAAVTVAVQRGGEFSLLSLRQHTQRHLRWILVRPQAHRSPARWGVVDQMEVADQAEARHDLCLLIYQVQSVHYSRAILQD